MRDPIDTIESLNDKINDAIGVLNDAKYRLNRYGNYQGFNDKLQEAYSLIVTSFLEADYEIDKINKQNRSRMIDER